MIFPRLPILALFIVCVAVMSVGAVPDPGPGIPVGGYCPEHGYWESRGGECPYGHSYGGSGGRNIGHAIGEGIYDFSARLFSGPSPEERARRRAERLQRLDEKIAKARQQLEAENREFRDSLRSMREECRMGALKASHGAADSVIKLFLTSEPILAEGGPKAAFVMPRSSDDQPDDSATQSSDAAHLAGGRPLTQHRIRTHPRDPTIRPWVGPKNPGESLKNLLTDPGLIMERAARDAELADMERAQKIIMSDSYQDWFLDELIDYQLNDLAGGLLALDENPVYRNEIDKARDRIVQREKAEILEAQARRNAEVHVVWTKILNEMISLESQGDSPAEEREAYRKFSATLEEAEKEALLRYRKRVAEITSGSHEEFRKASERLQESMKPPE